MRRNTSVGLLWLGAALLAHAQDAPNQGSLEDFVCPQTTGATTPLGMGRMLKGLVGYSSCQGCHTPADKITNDPFLAQMREDPWVLNDEVGTWEEEGRHRQAYLTLLGERSQRMGRSLGIERIEHDARCLTCHATAPAEWLAGDPLAVDKLLDSPLSVLLTRGVSCEACHGAAGDWQAAHIPTSNLTGVNKQWRFMGGHEKQQKYGFYDVRSPGSRARMCVSCHVGDPERGRLVTHEMYAAGHPPLPAFEVETFLRDMPPHWRRLGASPSDAPQPSDAIAYKGQEVTADFLRGTNDAYFSRLRSDYPKSFARLTEDYSLSFDRSRSLLVGAIVTWVQERRVTAALTSNNPHPFTDTEKRWPELASFECAACHHDLKIDGWRSRRHPLTTPGRPVLQNRSSPVLEAARLFLADEKAYSEAANLLSTISDAEEFLATATTRHPFGDRETVARRLSTAAADADRLAVLVERVPFTRKRSEKFLRSLIDVGARRLLNYESGRHLVWGIDEVIRESGPSPRWAGVAAELEKAKAMFVGDLADSKVRTPQNIQLPGVGQQTAELINLQPILEKAADYDAERLKAIFQDMQRAERG